MKEMRIRDLFNVRSGDCHATSELDTGATPLISCGDLNNGLVGHYNIPDEWKHRHAITVAYNGSWPLTTKFHPYEFGAKDDVAVLEPRRPMPDSVMLYVAAQLNRMVWRYSHGRKCFREKLQDVRVVLPVVQTDGAERVDEAAIEALFQRAVARVTAGTRASMDGLCPPPSTSVATAG